MDRFARLLSTSTRSSRILEVGAGYAPIAPRSAGWNTFIIDHASQDDLRTKYAALGVDLNSIEKVDFIWQGGPLHETVPRDQHGSFDTLIASHVIEHIPDFAGFLISARHLLKPDGVIAFAVPDRRYCFDYFKPFTTTGDILEAHAARRDRHSLRTIWNHHAYAIDMDGIGAWGQAPAHRISSMGGFHEAQDALAVFSDRLDSPYVDCHTWIFTPANFELAVLELGQLEVIDWRLDELYGPEGCEFFTFLRRGREPKISAQALDARRIQLMRRQLLETKEQIDWAIAGGALSIGEPAGAHGHEVQAKMIQQLDALANKVQMGEARLAESEANIGQQLAGLTTDGQAQGARLAALEHVVGRIGEALRPLRFFARLVRPSR